MKWGVLLSSLALVFCSCSPAPSSIYYWKTVLSLSKADTDRLAQAGYHQVGLRLFDWSESGEVGALVVRNPLPTELSVVPVVYVTLDRLQGWAGTALDPDTEARTLLHAIDTALAPAWSGKPLVYQLDADWSVRTRDSWFAVAKAFGALVHERGARFEITVRLHQYRDRERQGIPPADGGVLMLYGVGDAVLDPALVSGYLSGPAYPLPLVAAFPSYTQVRQLNGYGELVALHRLGAGESLPLADLSQVANDRYEVKKRSSLAGRPLLAHDVLAVDRVDDELRKTVARLPSVARLIAAAGGRVWFFDYDPGDNVPRLN